MNQKLINHLLKTDDPSLKYRVNTELLDIPSDDKANIHLKKEILNSKAVKSLLNKMHPDGYWLQTNSRTKETVGDGVEYGSFASTHFCLSYLSQLGLTKDHPLIEKASERYLNLQKEDGDFWNHMSCLIGYNICTFIKLGYKEDERVRKAVELLLNTSREDGGYLCNMHEKGRKNKKSCIRGAAQALFAFAKLPEYHKHQRVLKLVTYFLKRGGIYNSRGDDFVNKDMLEHSFPLIWRINDFEILEALGRMGYGMDKRLEKAWNYLESRQNQDGMYDLDFTPAQCPWKIGRRGNCNKWVTFHVLLALKHRDF